MCSSTASFFLFLATVLGQLLIPGAPNAENVPLSVSDPPACPTGQVFDPRSKTCRVITEDDGESSSSNIKHAEVTQNCPEGQIFNEESNGCVQQIASRLGMDVIEVSPESIGDIPIRDCPEGQVLIPHLNTCRPVVGSQGDEL